MAEETRRHWIAPIIEAACRRTSSNMSRRRTVEEIILLAVELVHEGREGRKIGTLFVVGDVGFVSTRSRPLLLDPLHGHAPEVCHVERRDFREAVKELAQLDGAFLVEDDGTFVAAARFIDVDLQSASVLPAGLGARHAAGASISGAADAIAVVVSESSVVRVFSRGELRAEIVPEFFHGGADTFFAIEAAEVRELPEVGLTIAFADDGG
jgi:DNA integrity scanning protein DisA with diadenylate cyclase activity